MRSVLVVGSSSSIPLDRTTRLPLVRVVHRQMSSALREWPDEQRFERVAR